MWRPFPGGLDLHETDPFLLLDQLGPVEYGPNEAKGAPWHPHRGFETVTYVLDGEIAHHDSNGGGGLIGEGDTQWMTAGGGILHDEVPSERAFRDGGPAHGVQLWVNLPSRLKFTPPRYQAITGDDLVLLSSDDGGALVRLIAGDLAGHPGPGSTRTRRSPTRTRRCRPGARARRCRGTRRSTRSPTCCSARATRAPSGRPVDGPRARGVRARRRDHAARRRPPGRTVTDALEVLLLGGLPIREPIAHYGPFVMNTRDEIIQAVDDFNAGRMGTIPAVDLAPERRSTAGVRGASR